MNQSSDKGSTQAAIVWVLSDDRPGHMSQSKGLVAALAAHRDVQAIWVPVALRAALLRAVLRLCAGLLPRVVLPMLLPLAYRRGPWPQQSPDLIISSGGDTLYALGALAARFAVPSVFSGTSKRYPKAFVDCVFTVVPDSAKNNVVLPLPPADLSLSEAGPDEDLVATGAPGTADRRPVGCVLIGGDGAGCTFHAQDWQRLSAWMQGQGAIRWQLTTSRRTGAAAEQTIQQALADQSITLDRGIWWAANPERAMAELLGHCDFVVCTQDSLSMLAEAIYTGKPVFVFAPEAVGMTANDQAAIAHYEQQGLLQRVVGVEKAAIGPGRHSLLVEVQAQIAAAIGPLLD